MEGFYCLPCFPHECLAHEHGHGQAHVTFARTGMGTGPGSGHCPSLANTPRVSVVCQTSSTGVSAAETVLHVVLWNCGEFCGYVEPIRRGLLGATLSCVAMWSLLGEGFLELQ